jgi:asparagine synthase (glutamine-hydrolysing)
MCGICGAIQVDRTSPRQVLATAVLDRMTDALRHRGPDDRGLHSGPGAAIGVRRLSIVDVQGGHQPVANEDGTVWAGQNGELYNHEAVRADLVARGHVFTSRCDTEILPHLYEQFGDRLPAHLNGKFALVVWDQGKRRALLARDRLGVKPLYYAVVGDVLVFASEIKAVLASGLVDTSLDYEAIDAYLTLGFFPDPATPLAAVRKLPPGHRLIVDNGIRIEPYWEFPAPAPDRTLTKADAVTLVGEALDVAVRDRLMSDVPLGAMLSGGLDSTLVVAMMARASSEPVKTFSVGFVESGPENELEVARRVAAAYGTDHHELELSMQDEATSLEDLVWALDEPVADLSAIGFEALSRLASRHVKVALTGQGADELFGGYTRHVRAAVVTRARRAPKPLVHVAARAMGLMGGRWGRFAAALTARDATERYLALRTPFMHASQRPAFVQPPLSQTASAALRAIDAKADGTIGHPLSDALYLDSRLGLVDDMLLYFDRVSMAHSLEARVPFLDHRVVELAARIPPELKVDGRTTKAVLRRLGRELVPEEVLARPKVGFFNRAVEGWVRMQLQGQARDVLLNDAAAYQEFIQIDAVRRSVDAFDDPARRLLSPDGLYAILVLEAWLTSFVPRALAIGRAGYEAA